MRDCAVLFIPPDPFFRPAGSRFMGLWSEGKPTWVQQLNGDAPASTSEDNNRSLQQALQARDMAVQVCVDCYLSHWPDAGRGSCPCPYDRRIWEGLDASAAWVVEAEAQSVIPVGRSEGLKHALSMPWMLATALSLEINRTLQIFIHLLRQRFVHAACSSPCAHFLHALYVFVIH